MENKGNNSVQASMKSGLHLLNRQPKGLSSESHQAIAFSSARPKGKILNFGPRRRSEWEGGENFKEKGGYLKRPAASSENSKQIKLKTKSSSETPDKPNKVDWQESTVSNSLLPLALEAQQRTTASVRLLRNSFRNKADGICAKLVGSMGLKEDANLTNAPVKPADLSADSARLFFENSYASCLEEIFQSWLKLMYLIMNLKPILNRLLETSGKETFKPDIEFEKAVIIQATECVAFLSRLKMNSVMESLDEINLANDPKLKNFQILDFEERISSSFFSEMETLSKKAKELMEQFKKERHSLEN